MQRDPAASVAKHGKRSTPPQLAWDLLTLTAPFLAIPSKAGVVLAPSGCEVCWAASYQGITNQVKGDGFDSALTSTVATFNDATPETASYVGANPAYARQKSSQSASHMWQLLFEGQPVFLEQHSVTRRFYQPHKRNEALALISADLHIALR
jgi:hypothetical protein